LKLLAQHIIKVPKEMLTALLAQRNLVNKYEKHNLLKSYSYFFLLKSLTNSGTIHNFSDQKPTLRKFFKVERNTFNTIIAKLCELELIKIDGNDDLQLCAWSIAAEKLNCDFTKNYFEVNYSTNDKQTLYYLLFALDIAANQHKQANAIQKKLGLNSSNLEALCNSLSELSGIAAHEIKKFRFAQFQKLLMEWQKKTFTIRTTHFSVLHSLRVDTNRSLKSLRNDWSVKDFRTVTYIKRQLEKLKIVSNEKAEIIFSDSGNRMINVCKKYCDIYNHSTKKRAFRFTDQLILNISITM
jgi:hypothetical protein